MSAKVIFLRRTQKEVEVFGGEIYIDIDGKNIAVLGTEDFTIELTNGAHNIKMYKSHTYNTFIGNAQTEIMISDDEDLLVKYSPPMIVNQPGHIVISDLNSSVEIDSLAKEKENKIIKDDNEAKRIKREEEEKTKNGIIIFVIIVIVSAILYGLSISSIYNY